MKKQLLWLVWLLAGITAGCSSENTEKHQTISMEKVEFIAPGFEGGGWDVTARSMQNILQERKLVEAPIEVMNKTGGGGEIGWKYVKQQTGHVLAMNSSLLITNHLLGQSQLTYEDFTPIATLSTEWEVVVVSKNSSIQSAKALMEKLKKNTKAFKIGVSPRLGNDDHLSFVEASKEFDIQPSELEFLVYTNSDKVVDALLRKEIDAATMPLSEAKKQYENGKVKILVISSDKRLKGFKEVPTWKEEGIPVVFQHWRGVMGPPGMTEEEVDYWDKVIHQMVHTNEWKAVLAKHNWDYFYKGSKDTKLFLERQSKMYEELMNDLDKR